MRLATIATITLSLSCKAIPTVQTPKHTAPATVAAPAPADSEHSPNIAMMRCFEREGDPRGWPARTPTDGDSWDLQARYSYCPWTVTLEDGQVHAEARWWPFTAEPVLPFQPSFRPRYELARCSNPDGSEEADEKPAAFQTPSAVAAFADGYLVGYNSGEFGGGLYWYDEHGELRQQILDENVHEIVARGEDWIVFTGLAHMFTDDGRATVVEFDAGSFQVARSLDVLGAPRAILVESEESILVATSRRIVRVVEAKTVEWVYTSAEGFEPTSLVRDTDGTLYLGAQYFVVKLTPMPDGFHESWLAPPGATRSREAPDVY